MPPQPVKRRHRRPKMTTAEGELLQAAWNDPHRTTADVARQFGFKEASLRSWVRRMRDAGWDMQRKDSGLPPLPGSRSTVPEPVAGTRNGG